MAAPTLRLRIMLGNGLPEPDRATDVHTGKPVHWRNRMKRNPKAFKAYKTYEMQMARERRANWTEAQKQKARESGRERTRLFRQRQKAKKQEELDDAEQIAIKNKRQSRAKTNEAETKTAMAKEAVVGLPNCVADAVFVQSDEMPTDSVHVRGYDFNQGIDYHKLLQSYKTTGFQATNFGLAVEEINKMLDKKAIPLTAEEIAQGTELNPVHRTKTNCTIFLGYTSNLISSGLRENICFLAQHNLVDVIVSTAGGIEEDFIKCVAPTFLGDFNLSGRQLRSKGINRIGNLLVPNSNYCHFEDWIMKIFDQMLEEQKTQGVHWTPSRMIARLGKEINHPDSVYYWAYKNNIPVFSPAITDGSIGDMLYFHSYKNPGLILDIVEDIRLMNNQAVFAAHTGMIILGGGLVKHHICNANLMRNGADFSLFVNVASEFDGSDSGARPDEAISWGKIRATATPVKIYGEATLIVPLLIAETFAQRVKLPHKTEEIIK